jgi:hypothetical protein
VRALSSGTEIGLALEDDEVVYGRLEDVDASALTLRHRHGAERIARPRIARLAIRTRAGTTRAPNILKAGIGAAVISGLFALVIASISENGAGVDDAWTIFAVGSITGTALGAARAPTPRYNEQVIYIRP